MADIKTIELVFTLGLQFGSKVKPLLEGGKSEPEINREFGQFLNNQGFVARVDHYHSPDLHITHCKSGTSIKVECKIGDSLNVRNSKGQSLIERYRGNEFDALLIWGNTTEEDLEKLGEIPTRLVRGRRVTVRLKMLGKAVRIGKASKLPGFENIKSDRKDFITLAPSKCLGNKFKMPGLSLAIDYTDERYNFEFGWITDCLSEEQIKMAKLDMEIFVKKEKGDFRKSGGKLFVNPDTCAFIRYQLGGGEDLLNSWTRFLDSILEYNWFWTRCLS